MKRAHNYEFKKNLKINIISFFIPLLLLLSKIAFLSVLFLNKNSFTKFRKVLFHIKDIFGGFITFLCIAIIYIKPDDDIFQGLSKLDALIKISCF